MIGGVAIDITARIQAEEVIRESEVRFRTMADNTPAIIYTTQVDGYCTFLSKAWTTLTGKSTEAGLGFGWGDAVHPEDLELTRGVFAQDPPAMFRVEFRLAAEAGGHHWVIGAGAPRYSQDGAFLGYVGSVLDIDKEKRTEDALRNSVQLYRAIGESIDYGVWVCDPTGAASMQRVVPAAGRADAGGVFERRLGPSRSTPTNANGRRGRKAAHRRALV